MDLVAEDDGPPLLPEAQGRPPHRTRLRGDTACVGAGTDQEAQDGSGQGYSAVDVQSCTSTA